MSIVSSRVSSVSSILKGSGVRSALVNSQKRICFKLPRNLKTVLLNYENGCDRQAYQDMVCILRDSNVKDYELLELLNDLQECMSMLGPLHKLFIEVLLNINWTDRSSEIIASYKKFVEDLTCMHIYHLKLVIDKLIFQFRLVGEGATPWTNGKCPENYKNKISHIHDTLRKFLKIIPMSSDVLVQSLTSLYPHVSEGIVPTQQYLFSLIQILDYAPQLRKDILCLIINRLVALDVSVPPSEIQNCEDDEDMEEDENEAIFKLDDTNIENNSKKSHSTEMKHPGAQMLDVCMEQVLAYVYNCCHVEGQLQIDSLRIIYNDLLYTFERIILTTHASHHVQFIMFYLCSFKLTVAETFIRWLWQKVSNPNVAPIIRQSAVSYIASLLARATYITVGLLQSVLLEMSTWIHSYISSQDSLECANSDVRVHTVFYSVCQAMFYLLAFRHKDIIDGKKHLLFLQGLNLTKIVTCRLNPLKVCQPAVVQNFAAVTRNYQLAYCYTVIERNSRSNLPVLQTTNRFINWLDTFFPFDPYLLVLSGQRITPLYNNSQCTMPNTTDSYVSRSSKSECDEDDFMDESFTSQSLDSQNHFDKFSYSTSPGFIYT
ncbi:RNA polymerase I-specific transcription initiation factor RRN3 [Nasonia vitripennis]|uniref:RNA polymerase I-specific transcription initiation factor RRN3 n=1 Tax=Nasonia vitripennis TaxID=7425 RepID=A0A7M7G3Z4_NASVI|nr:RNA polymerase I-specific transcription initiation factor RRN3 [Nasonia vitripennis]